ncbi:hypothetical protein GCM10029978_086780 [Actinoallomurus acanthiterrae]
MPSHPTSGTVNFVTQWKSAVTFACGIAATSGQVHRYSRPASVAPYTRRSQRSGRNFGTGP